MSHDSCEPFGASSEAVVDGVMEGELLTLRILSEQSIGRQRTKVENDFASSWYESWLLWDSIGMPFDKRFFGTPVLR